jgi:SnoaL-like domain
MNKSVTLQQKIQRLQDLGAIRNLMGRYEYLHAANLHGQTPELFAQKAAGVRLENGARGIYLGTEGITRFFGDLAKGMGDGAGQLHLHLSTTPVIEVAADGQTAQGVWISPGVETSPGKDDKAASALWAWIKYGVDFIKEDTQWKIWHLHMYRVFMAPYDKSWTEVNPAPAKQAPDADRPNSYDWVYRTTVAPENVPAPPMPYAAWDESRSYVK